VPGDDHPCRTLAKGRDAHPHFVRTLAKGRAAHPHFSRTLAKGLDAHPHFVRTLAKGRAAHPHFFRTLAKGPDAHPHFSRTLAKGHDVSPRGALTLVAFVVWSTQTATAMTSVVVWRMCRKSWSIECVPAHAGSESRVYVQGSRFMESYHSDEGLDSRTSMSRPETTPNAHIAHPTVVLCYRLLDLVSRGGSHDFTEGIYVNGDVPHTREAYLAAQRRQADYLLDQIDCRSGSRILDIGCGAGRLLKQAERRGLRAVGITISEEQVTLCRRRDLDARLLNYRDIPRDWDGQFDGLLANGSLEHFVSVADAAAGRDDALYQEMFSIGRRLLRTGARLVTTAIHFREGTEVSAADLQRGPYTFLHGSPEYHFAMILERTFGGWYPRPGQLEACAAGAFRLLREVDGTEDYRLTSEFWLGQLRTSRLYQPRGWPGLLRSLVRYPRPTLEMLRCLLLDQSWNWQFRGNPPPTVLLRQTWEAL